MRVEELGPDAGDRFVAGSAEEKDAFLADHQSIATRAFWRAYHAAEDRQRSAAIERFQADVARIRAAISFETLTTRDEVMRAVFAVEKARLGRSLSMSETHVCRAVVEALVAELVPAGATV